MKRARFRTDYESPIGKGMFKVNTGEWRYQRPITDEDRCRLCAACWLVCPTNSRYAAETHFESDLAYCKGCGMCANECPAGAITMVEEAKAGAKPTEARAR